MARKPADRQYGKHSFKGVRYDKNGNPIYTSDTLSDDEKKAMGWKYSKKHGLHGQVSDPSRFNESKNTIRLTENELKRIIAESVKNILKESGERVLNLQYDENLSRSRGRKYYFCQNNGRYYTNIDGEWYICTDNYYLEPDVHLDDNVKVVTESTKIVKEGIDGWYTNYKNRDGVTYDDFAEAFLRTISETYQSPFQASQVVFQIVTQAARICGCDYNNLMEQILRDYENMQFSK